jgi:hypothetical protein
MRSYHCRDLQRWSAARADYCHSPPGEVLMSLTFTDDLSTWPSTSNHVFRAPDELWCRKDTDSEHGLVLRYCKWSQVHGALTCLRYSQSNVLKCYSGSKSRRNHFTAWILFWATPQRSPPMRDVPAARRDSVGSQIKVRNSGQHPSWSSVGWTKC